MLFLGNAQDHQPAVANQVSSRIVPDRHVLAAAGSPRCEVQQQDPLAAIVRKRNRPPGPEVWQRELGMRFPHLRTIADGTSHRRNKGRRGQGHGRGLDSHSASLPCRLTASQRGLPTGVRREPSWCRVSIEVDPPRHVTPTVSDYQQRH